MGLQPELEQKQKRLILGACSKFIGKPGCTHGEVEIKKKLKGLSGGAGEGGKSIMVGWESAANKGSVKGKAFFASATLFPAVWSFRDGRDGS